MPWRLPSSRRRQWSCLQRASWFISGPRNGRLSGGRDRTRLAWQCPGPGSPSSPWTGADRARSWRLCITCGPAAGTGFWVNAFRGELRTQWFPAPAARRLADAGAPEWATEIFDRLRAANGGTLSGFFDVFAWREPGQAGLRGQGRAGPDQADSAQVRRDRTAPPPAGGVHDRRDRRVFCAKDASRRSPVVPRARLQRGGRRPSGRVLPAGTCSLRWAGLRRPDLVMAPLRCSGPGARRGGLRTT